MREPIHEPSISTPAQARPASAGGSWRAYLGATLTVALMTAVIAPWQALLGLTNTVMLLLLAAVLAAYRFGPGPGTHAAVLSVACFDFFYVPPQYSFTVHDAHYTITFLVMLSVALLVGQITARLRHAATVASERERRMRALFELARDLSSALTLAATADIGRRYVADLFDVVPGVLLQNDAEQLDAAPGSDLPNTLTLDIAQWVYAHERRAGRGTEVFAGDAALYLPLKAPMRTRGVLALVPRDATWGLNAEQSQLLDTMAALIAIALERIHFIAVAQQAVVDMESERLRNSLLAALSHDLKTPLTVLAGLADTIALAGPPLALAQADIAASIREEALRTSAMVQNLLELARLQAGKVRLQREWQPLEEVIGAALQARATMLAARSVNVTLPPDLPLVEFDTLLMERALCNLLENAAKYTPPGTSIEIAARCFESWIELSVADHGPGLPAGGEARLFEKFTRGDHGNVPGGMGLGLSIVRAVMDAHQGAVVASNRATGGACFTLRLPAGTPPAWPREDA